MHPFSCDIQFPKKVSTSIIHAFPHRIFEFASLTYVYSTLFSLANSQAKDHASLSLLFLGRRSHHHLLLPSSVLSIFRALFFRSPKIFMPTNPTLSLLYFPSKQCYVLLHTLTKSLERMPKALYKYRMSIYAKVSFEFCTNSSKTAAKRTTDVFTPWDSYYFYMYVYKFLVENK